MGYCSYLNVQAVLPENVRIGDSSIGTPNPGRPGVGGGRSNISPTEAQHYIALGEQYIDSRLKPFYLTPLRRIKMNETEVLLDISHGANVVITVNDSGVFTTGDLVRIQDNNSMETCTITATPTLTTMTLGSVQHNYYSSNNLTVSILCFPDPIPLVCARMAASFILDRLYTASNEPEISKYGANQRNQASGAVDDILRGVIALFGQEMTGRRFLRGSLLDKFSSPAEVQKGEEKE